MALTFKEALDRANAINTLIGFNLNTRGNVAGTQGSGMKTNTHKITALTAIEENLSITICANGYSLEVSGKDAKDDWINAKYVVSTFDSLIDLVTEIDQRCKASRGF